jgi:hypothetical protein
LEFTYRGTVFRVLPEKKKSRLAPQPFFAPDANMDRDSRALLKEMEAEWERDWSEL